jgi:DNA-binding transcriptional regulator YhcF (GntR family)
MDKLSNENKFAILPEWVIELNVSHTAFRLYAVLARYADNITHQAFPSLETLAERLQCSEKTVRRAIDDLVEHGAITKHNRGRYNSNLYTIMTTRPEGTKMSQEETEMSLEGTKMSQRVDTDDQVTITTELEPLNDINSQFNSFWEIYPRKLGKGEAKGAFMKAVTKHGVEVVLEGVRRFAADPNLPAPQYVPRAATWLNQERWEDEPYQPVDLLKVPGVQVGLSRSPYVGGPREWVQDLHDMGEHFECKPGEFGCK